MLQGCGTSITEGVEGGGCGWSWSHWHWNEPFH